MMIRRRENATVDSTEKSAGGPSTTVSSPNFLSVVSYNLLAPLYVRSLDQRTGQIQPFAAFEWVLDNNILDWDLRKQRLLHDLQHCGADVICLQELQLEKRQQKEPTAPQQNGNDGVEWGMPAWIQPLLVSDDGIDNSNNSNSSSSSSSSSHQDNNSSSSSQADSSSKKLYRAVLPVQSELSKIAERNQRVLGVEAAVTVAVLVKNSDSSSAFSWDIFGLPTDPELHHIHSNNTVSVCLKQHRRRQDHTNKSSNNNNTKNPEHDEDDEEEPPIVVVTSVHLDAKDETKRVAQLSKSFQSSRTMLDKYNNNNNNNNKIQTEKEQSSSSPRLPLTMILAGDYNVEFQPGSCLKSFLHQAQNEQENDDVVLQHACTQAHRFFEKDKVLALDEWKELHQKVKNVLFDYCTPPLQRVDTGPTRCAHDDEDDQDSSNDSALASAQKRMANWKLDHFLYTMDRLKPVAQWSTLEDDAESCKLGLPNHRHATSDHLPIACVFEFVERRGRLVQSKKAQLSQTLQTLVEAHQSALTALKQEMEHERQAIDDSLAASRLAQNTTNGESTVKEEEEDDHDGNKEQKKRRKGKPSPEIVAFLRKSRALTKELLQQQLSERQEFIKKILQKESPMSTLLYIEHLVQLPWRKWVEEGGAMHA